MLGRSGTLRVEAMSKQKELRYEFVVTLNSREGSGQKFVTVDGNVMEVNNRGDLLIVESQGAYGQSKVIAAFRSGTWIQSMRQPKPTL